MSVNLYRYTEDCDGAWYNNGPSMFNDMLTMYECSVCGAQYQDISAPGNYCPNCGAKMDKEEE